MENVAIIFDKDPFHTDWCVRVYMVGGGNFGVVDVTNHRWKLCFTTQAAIANGRRKQKVKMQLTDVCCLCLELEWS